MVIYYLDHGHAAYGTPEKPKKRKGLDSFKRKIYFGNSKRRRDSF
jgi:hypothetical protein